MSRTSLAAGSTARPFALACAALVFATSPAAGVRAGGDEPERASDRRAEAPSEAERPRTPSPSVEPAPRQAEIDPLVEADGPTDPETARSEPVGAPAKDDARGNATPPQSESAEADPRDTFAVGPFSRANGALPPGWEPLLFESIPSHTRYTLEREGADWIVRADSAASASGLIRKVEIDLSEYPVLQWRWRVGNVLEKGDVTQKSGDDYPARIYIAFKYVPERVPFLRRVQYRAGRALFGDIPIGAINYIWASNAKPGAVVDNPYAGDFVKMIVVESGGAKAGTWQTEQRNVLEDYRAAFGEDPPPVEGVALMTDTDNTGERATSWYGDVRFVRAAATK